MVLVACLSSIKLSLWLKASRVQFLWLEGKILFLTFLIICTLRTPISNFNPLSICKAGDLVKVLSMSEFK